MTVRANLLLSTGQQRICRLQSKHRLIIDSKLVIVKLKNDRNYIYSCVVRISDSLDDKLWLVSYHKDNGPTSYFIYNRKTGGLGFLFHDRKKLADLPLVEMKPVSIKARDGVEIPRYLSVPHKNLGWETPGPLVMYVHHGPQLRENWEFNPRVQFLANRGYAVLLVNYRGSAGLD